LSLNQCKVDPNSSKRFKKRDALVASEIVAFGKTRFLRKLAGDFFSAETEPAES
jgi:hypothetical protein